MVLFRHPKGSIEAAGAVNLRSRQGWTGMLKRGAFSMCEFSRVCCAIHAPLVRGSGDPSTIAWRVASASQAKEKEYDED